jgi:hypothetical protein
MKNFLRLAIGPVMLLCGILTVSGQSNLPPTEQDCLGAIPVCQSIYTTTNSYTGHGNVYPEIHTGSACPNCMDGEKNDVFYIFTVQTSGIFRFNLTPNNPNNDYDWILFNMTNANCDDLYPMANQLQVSCNSYGNIGYNGPTGINSTQSNNKNCNGPGTDNGPPFNKDVNVQAGETYLLNISNWSSTNQSGYTLDFSASTAQIYDNVPPCIDSIQRTISCAGTSTLFIRFSENVKCYDIENHPEKFSLTSGSSSYAITDVTSTDCEVGAPQTFTCQLHVTPPLFGGNYTLNIVGVITDLCGNVALFQGYPFQLVEENAPVASAGNDTTVPNGAIITLHGNATGGTGAYSWHLEPSNLLVNPNVRTPTTVNLGASTTFTLTVTDSIGCHDEDPMTVTVTGGPLGIAPSASPATICAGESSQLTAMPTGGTGNYTYNWTSNPPGFTSDIPDPVVYPLVTTTYSLQVFDGYTMVYGNTTVTVHPKPVANAGSDVSVPYGTTTTLHGSATGGSGNYEYNWTSDPPGFYSQEKDPLTPNLNLTTLFILVVTDASTGCTSDPVQVVVTVTGSALNVNPIAAMPTICYGNSTQLFSLAGGGSGNYTFSWTSDPPGFSSTQQNPVVTPAGTTVYYVTADDGYNQASGSVTVTVNPLPQIYLGPLDTLVCIYDSVILDAGNPGSTYYWSNGSTGQTIDVTTSGLTFDYQTYSVIVQNALGCPDSATIHITFTFSACTGINEHPGATEWKVYPNPSGGEINLEISHPEKDFSIQVMDNLGRVLEEENYHTDPGTSFRATLPEISLPKGIYYVRLSDRNGWSIMKLVIR